MLTALGIGLAVLASAASGMYRARIRAARITARRCVEPWSIGAMFANFVPTSDPARIATAYDNQAGERLLALADQYDPAGTLATPGQLAR